jgi:tRNA A37 methylthiotransferase MiaB
MFPPYHSFTEDSLIEECSRIVKESGKREVILLADSLGEYGKDNGSNLPTLMRKLKKIHPELKIALNNLNPANFIQDFNEMATFLKNGDIRHLNLPIQSASQKVLSLMNRPYSRVNLDRIFNLLNDIGFVEFDTHIIIGFPGEREKDFDETIRFILHHRPKYVLTSRYMETPEMPSARLSDKVDIETMNQRSRETLRRIKDAGIICNTDDSDIAKDRLQRINRN